MSKKFKFRAECAEDVLYLISLLSHEEIVSHNIEPDFESLPDADVDIELKNTTLDELRDIMRNVPDGHVMIQTVMHAEKYTGERNYEL